MEKVLVFDLLAEFAQFKKYFSNMSPISFLIPPRTTLAGMVGAIAGIDKEVNPEMFNPEECFFSIQIVKPIRKMRLPMNYLKTTTLKHISRFEEHKPTNIEFLRDVCYRVYFWHSKAEIYEQVKRMLECHKSHYTLSMGMSNCLADFVYRGEYAITPIVTDEYIILKSVIKSEELVEIDIENVKAMQKTVVPYYMKNDREPVLYKEVIYSTDDQGLPAKVSKCYRCDYEDIRICEY